MNLSYLHCNKLNIKLSYWTPSSRLHSLLWIFITDSPFVWVLLCAWCVKLVSRTSFLTATFTSSLMQRQSWPPSSGHSHKPNRKSCWALKIWSRAYPKHIFLDKDLHRSSSMLYEGKRATRLARTNFYGQFSRVIGHFRQRRISQFYAGSYFRCYFILGVTGSFRTGSWSTFSLSFELFIYSNSCWK